VAVLEEDPVSRLHALLDQGRSYGFLALPQRLEEQTVLHPCLSCELDNLLVGICALAQDEDHWCRLLREGEKELKAALGAF